MPPSFLPRLALLCLMVLALPGCASHGSTLGYYWQSVRGHLQIMQAAEPIDQWITRTDTTPALRERLHLAQRARAFAVAELGLPDNASYRRYADLKRPAAVWNVVAAPPYALTLHTWCFTVRAALATAVTSPKPMPGPRPHNWHNKAWKSRCMACPPTPPWVT